MNDAVMIAMSGGVDSAVAAHLASAGGRHCAGVTMQHFAGCGDRDARDAELLCRMLGIPHRIAHLEEAFTREVILPFIASYEAGKTPNPCVMCNKAIKFGALLDFAKMNGYGRIATGHYARIEHSGARSLIRRATDVSKDQTYMLYSLTQDVLSCVEVPLGTLTKAEVREIATALGFPMAQRADSQDICFIPDGDYAAFIERFTKKQTVPGKFLATDGTVLGEHKGQLHYTIGQRKGLGIAFGKPTYVCRKDPVSNTVTLGSNEDLFTRDLTAHRVNLIAVDIIPSPMRVQAKIRYQAKPANATVEQIAPDRIRLRFDEPQRAISKGQSVVLYDDDVVIGGGIIE